MSEETPSGALTGRGGKRKNTGPNEDESKKRDDEASSTSSKKTRQEETTKFDLDKDQQSVVDKWDNKFLCILGGPGSGKTSTLVHLIAKIQKEKKDSRLLVLVFNRQIALEIEKRLQDRSVELLSKDSISSQKESGCLVSTFDAFAFSTRSDSSKPDISQKGYKELLEESATELNKTDKESPLRKWDWVIIDEGQDLNYTHTFIVETLAESSEHLIVAGDPRQQLSKGTTWFNKMWADNRHTSSGIELSFNHRSTPEIVDFLNKYSQHNFPDVHFDQVAKREDTGTLELFDKREEAGKRLALSKHEDAYAITPVTTGAFQNELTTKTIRQVVHEENPESIVRVYSGSQSNNDAYIVGTSRALKGTQRSRVVVYGLTAPYTSYNMRKTEVQRCFYVALSRAETHLHIMINDRINEDNPLAFHVEKQKLKPTPEKKQLGSKRFLDVTKLSDGYKWNQKVAFISIQSHSALTIDDKGDDDFVEEYLKTMMQDECSADPDRQATTYPYSYVEQKYTKQIARNWTVSSRLKDDVEKHREMCQPFKVQLKKYLKEDGNGLKWNAAKNQDIFPHRFDKNVGRLGGKLDCVGSNSGLKLVYTKEIGFTHRETAAMLATLHFFPEAFVMNLRTGEFEKVECVENKELKNLARVKLALEINYPFHKQKEIEFHEDFVKACCIAVGEVIDPSHNLLMEIGAVAFSMDGTIRGTYHDVLKGVKDVSSGGSEEREESSTDQSTSGAEKRQQTKTEREFIKQTKLRIVSERDLKADQSVGQRNFQEWVEAVSGRRCFLLSVASHLELSELGPTFDVFTILKDMPFASGSDEESKPTLEKFVTKAFGHDFTYVPGRAFEDAVAMAALMLKTVEVK